MSVQCQRAATLLLPRMALDFERRPIKEKSLCVTNPFASLGGHYPSTPPAMSLGTGLLLSCKPKWSPKTFSGGSHKRRRRTQKNLTDFEAVAGGHGAASAWQFRGSPVAKPSVFSQHGRALSISNVVSKSAQPNRHTGFYCPPTTKQATNRHKIRRASTAYPGCNAEPASGAMAWPRWDKLRPDAL